MTELVKQLRAGHYWVNGSERYTVPYEAADAIDGLREQNTLLYKQLRLLHDAMLLRLADVIEENKGAPSAEEGFLNALLMKNTPVIRAVMLAQKRVDGAVGLSKYVDQNGKNEHVED